MFDSWRFDAIEFRACANVQPTVGDSGCAGNALSHVVVRQHVQSGAAFENGDVAASGGRVDFAITRHGRRETRSQISDSFLRPDRFAGGSVEATRDSLPFDEQNPAVDNQGRNEVVGGFGDFLPEYVRLGDVPLSTSSNRLDRRFFLQLVVKLLPVGLAFPARLDFAGEQAALIRRIEEGQIDLFSFQDSLAYFGTSARTRPSDTSDFHSPNVSSS